MFSRHVHQELSAYCHGELSTEAMREVSEHLIGCSSCRADYDQIKLGVKFAELLPQVQAPDDLWQTIQRRAESRDIPRRSFHLLRPRFIAVAACLVLVVGVAGTWLYLKETSPFWEVVQLDGNPQIGKKGIKQKGRLSRGQWLETDGASRAQIAVGSIGQVEIDPNTRVRLIETKPTEHRLELAQGRLSARIWAPPKLFYVDTPSAVAADLGCAYSLEVDDKGATLLRVTSGWVALQLKDRESMVPAGAACATRPGVGPGTPYFEDATQDFREALRKIDFEEGYKQESLNSLLAAARVRDTLTLWHLVARVSGDDRARVYDRMAELVPPPEGVSRDGVLALNQQMLDSWKGKLESNWGNYSSPAMKALKKAWATGLEKYNSAQGQK
ncbi:MAG TPA: zf-HC2 domain-containing protein [Pyrinomonadaceae bacterium]|nr:zf-HC2 domain-containing protein [Pyrinomonadaceae bacterium]